MNGYVAQRRGRFYAVIYEDRDPMTGKEVRRWHPAGTDRAEAERLATKLAKKETSRVDAVRSLTFGAYLTSQWLPAKKLHLATSTYRGYERNVALHILPPSAGSASAGSATSRSKPSTTPCSTPPKDERYPRSRCTRST